MYSAKARLAKWFLWSLIPNGIFGVVCFIIYMLSNTSDDFEEWSGLTKAGALGTFLSWPTWWLALVGGLLLKSWAGVDTRRSYRESRRYADLNGWQPISDVAWKSFKRRGVTFSVQPVYEQPTFVLLIDLDGEIVTTEGFSKSLYALRFADYLWEHAFANTDTITKAEVVQEQRVWEQTNAIALRR